jgi:hypothetical protein
VPATDWQSQNACRVLVPILLYVGGYYVIKIEKIDWRIIEFIVLEHGK